MATRMFELLRVPRRRRRRQTELRSAFVGIVTLLPTFVTNDIWWLPELNLRRPLLLMLVSLLEARVGWVGRTTTTRMLELLRVPRRRRIHPKLLLLLYHLSRRRAGVPEALLRILHPEQGCLCSES